MIRQILLLALVAVAVVLADDPYTKKVEKHSTITVPQSPESRPDCVVRRTIANDKPLAQKSVLILFDGGAAAYDVRVAWQYYSTRGAAVTFGCIDSAQANVFLDVYYPLFQKDCEALSTLTSSNYHVLFIPGGYESVLALRVNEAAMNFVAKFATSAIETNTAVVVAGEATETLIDSRVLQVLDKSSSSNAFPATTKAVENALSSGKFGIEPTADVTTLVANLIKNGTQTTNAHRFIAIGSSVDDINALLSEVSAKVFAYNGDVVPLNCSINGDNLTSLTAGPFTPITDTNFPDLAKNTNQDSDVVNVSLAKSCVNPSGTNFCKGRKMSIIVAHGSHDVEVISAMKAFQSAGAIIRIFCPDDLLLEGFVYLMPKPARTVTYKLQCTRYYNSSMLATQSLVVVPSGPVATHRRLQSYDKLIEVMQYTGTFSLFGTALVMLTTQDLEEELTTVPYCPYTNVDLVNVGFQINASSMPIFVRNNNKGRSKLLGGYHDDTQNEDFSAFLTQSVSPLVWKNEKQAVGDRIFGALYIVIGCLAAVAVVVAMCVRAKKDAAHRAQYAATGSSEHRDYSTANDVY